MGIIYGRAGAAGNCGDFRLEHAAVHLGRDQIWGDFEWNRDAGFGTRSILPSLGPSDAAPRPRRLYWWPQDSAVSRQAPS
jgi:hypothetical protein